MKTQFLSFVIGLTLLSCEVKNNHPKLTQEQQKAIDDFSIADGFKIELVAAEPLVQDPVAMEIDENGQMYVVEMSGYPLDLSKTGRIKILKDTNKDGWPDKAIVFADSLLLPTGIMKWKKGLMVTDTENVVYFEDTNNDGKADIRKVMLTGFARTNPQHNLNSPLLGIDNWIYLAHQGEITPFVYKKEFGDEGREITFPNNPNAAKLAKNASGRNVRFRPDSFEVEELSGDSQFGQTFDAWGHHILTENAKHLYHEAIAATYLNQNPNLLIPEATQSISDHGDASEVYPTSESPNHELLTDKGVITSSCGVTWYLGNKFGEKYKNITFIAEPSHNLVHADFIKDNGASFTASRVFEKKEFLTSKDAWFRPVNFYVGPDGAMYVIDYYRQHIEHPEWMSEEMINSGTLYNGKTKGRIYRITPKNGLKMDWLDALKINELSDNELVNKCLDNPNIWYRKTAQRLLADKNSKSIIEPLKSLVRNAQNPEAKIHALWLLQKMGAVDFTTLQIALNDKTAGVVENASKILEKSNPSFIKQNEIALTESLTKLVNNQHPKVRYQLLCSLGKIDIKAVQNLRMAVLKKDFSDSWVGIAAIAGSKNQELALFEEMSGFLQKNNTKNADQFFTYLGATIANSGKENDIKKVLNTCTNYKINQSWQASTLSGISKLWQYKGITVAFNDTDKQKLVELFNDKTSPELLKVSTDLIRNVGLPKGDNQAIFKQALSWLHDSKYSSGQKSAALYLLSLQTGSENQNIYENLILHSKDESLKTTSFEVLANKNQSKACRLALTHWKVLSTSLKSQATELIVNNGDEIPIFLKAIETNQIPKQDLEWSKMVSMMNYYDTDVRNYARRVLAVDENRKVITQKYLSALDLKGNHDEGIKVFQTLCTTCHKMGEKGEVDFGPNLVSLKNRNPASILTEIINPNNSIADKYDQYSVHLKNKKIETGIIKNQNATSITLKQMGGNEILISKTEVEKLEKGTISAMPNGFENSISIQQMADLIAYIKK